MNCTCSTGTACVLHARWNPSNWLPFTARDNNSIELPAAESSWRLPTCRAATLVWQINIWYMYPPTHTHNVINHQSFCAKKHTTRLSNDRLFWRDIWKQVVWSSKIIRSQEVWLNPVKWYGAPTSIKIIFKIFYLFQELWKGHDKDFWAAFWHHHISETYGNSILDGSG